MTLRATSWYMRLPPVQQAALSFLENPGSVRPIPASFYVEGPTPDERLSVKGATLFTSAGQVHVVPSPLLDCANEIRCGKKNIGDPCKVGWDTMRLCFFGSADEVSPREKRFDVVVSSPEVIAWVMSHFQEDFNHPFEQPQTIVDDVHESTKSSPHIDWHDRLTTDSSTGLQHLHLDEFEMQGRSPEEMVGYLPDLSELGDMKISFKWSNSERQGIADYGTFYLVSTPDGLEKVLSQQVSNTPGMAFMFFEIGDRRVLAMSEYDDPGSWRSTSHHTIRRGMRLLLGRLGQNPDQATLNDARVRGYMKRIKIGTAHGDSSRIAVTNMMSDNFDLVKNLFIEHLGVFVTYKPVELTSRCEQRFSKFGWR